MVSLDLHVAKSVIEASHTDPVLSFSHVLHQQLFARQAVDLSACPQLRKMSNFFADTAYSSSDLQSLVDEIGRIQPQCNSVLADVLGSSVVLRWPHQLEDKRFTASVSDSV